MKVKLEMKHMLIILTTLSLLSCGTHQSSAEAGPSSVHGKLSNASGEMIYLVDVNTQKFVVVDSAKLDEKGEFAFHTKVPAKGFYNLKLSDSNFATLILDPSENVTVSGDAKNLGYTYKTTGSPDSKLFADFNTFGMENRKKLSIIKQKQDSIQGVFQYFTNQNKDPKKVDSISKALEPAFNNLSAESVKLMKEADQYAADFIDKNPGSFADLAVLQLFSDKEASFPYFEKVGTSLQAKYPNMKNLQSFYDYVNNMKKLAIGSPAPEIKLSTPEGKELALSSLRGKIVLVDFWASWCGPCRKENPNVTKLYGQYHSKGFEVFSVSLDKEKGAWTKAIADDKLVWPSHVSDLSGWQSSVVPLYGIKGIPMTVLLDKDGKIVAKNLRGEQLAAKLAELIK